MVSNRRQKMIEELERHIAAATAAVQELRAQQQLEQLPVEPENNNSVVQFVSQISGRFYSFAAIKWDGYWYITQDAINGVKMPRMKWADLVAMANTSDPIRRMYMLETIRPVGYARGGC